MRCEKIKKNGERCKANVFDESGMCLFHSSTKKAKEARKVKPLTKEKMIRILQRQIRKLEKEVKDPILRSGEIRRNIQMIQELKGELPSSPKNNEDPLDNILNKWEKEKNKGKK